MWEYPNGNYPVQEWQLAWTGIDGDEWIEHETREEIAESAMEDEAGLDDAGGGGAANDEVDAEETEPVDRKVPTTFAIDRNYSRQQEDLTRRITDTCERPSRVIP